MSEAQELEQYLLNTLPAEDQLFMEAKLLVNSDLQDKLTWQKNTYALVQHYGRKKLREEIEAAHQKLFTEKRFESFRKKINLIFKRH